MSQKSVEMARRFVRADIENGNDAGAFLGHLSDADLSTDEILSAFAAMADSEATKKFKQSVIVGESVKDVEDISGTNAFELNRVANLQKLASKLRGF